MYLKSESNVKNINVVVEALYALYDENNNEKLIKLMIKYLRDNIESFQKNFIFVLQAILFIIVIFSFIFLI